MVRAVLLRPLPYNAADRVVVIGETDNPAKADARETTSFVTYEEWKARARSFESIANFNGWSPVITASGEAERLNGSLVTSGVFNVFRIQPVLGRRMLPSDNVANGPLIVWISWSVWQTRFGGASDVIGRSLVLNGRAREIVGVLPRDFISPGGELSSDVWTANYHDERDGRTARSENVIARLAAGVTIDAARSELSGISQQLVKEHPNDYTGIQAVIFPFRELLIGSRTRGPILLLMLASALVLLIACANTSNLLIARGTYRAKEFAIRAAMGTTRGRLMRQLLTESIVLGAAGAALGLGMAALGVRGLVHMAPNVIQTQNVTLDPAVLSFALFCALAAAVVFGLLPALRAGRSDVQHVLREEGRGSTSASARRVRAGLAIVQLSLALSLVLSAGLLIKSFARVMQVSPGIRPDHLLTLFISLPGAKYDDTKVVPFYEELIARVQNTAGVVSAAGTSIVPFSGGWDRITVDTGTAKVADALLPEGDRYVVTASYFQTMGIPLLRGRTFASSDASGPPVAVIDEVFARKVAHNGSALGMRIGVPGRDTAATIIGIVGHVKHYGLDAESGGQIYIDHVQYPYRFLSLAIRTQGDPTAFTSTMRSVLRSLDPDLPMSEVKTVEGFMGDRTATRRFVLALLGVFATVALLLAAVGLYGVIAYTIAQRRREFGIRLALGASPGSLVQMVMREGGVLVGIGIASGIALALAGGQLLRSLLFGVSPLDLTVLLSAAAFLTGVAALAAWLPARRAAGADPLETLAAP